MNKKTVAIIIAAVVALVLLIGGTIFFLSKGFNPSDNSSTDSPSSDILNSFVDSNSQDTDSASKTDKSSTPTDTGSEKTDADSTVKSSTSVPSNAAFYIENTTASLGDAVKVPVKISKNPGFMAFIINFEYDTAVLKYKGYKSGNLLTNYEIEDNNGNIKFMNIENSDVKKDGTIVFLEFEVISKETKQSEIKIVVPEESIANHNEEYVNIGAQNGYVKIK
jgi:hypothetical protein